MDIVTIFEKFPNQEDCIDYIEKVRWQGKPRCPYCQSTNSTPEKRTHRHHCNNCNTAFAVTVGTIFHGTHLPIQKWFLALLLILNAKKGIASRQLARDLHVNKDTAWRISHKIREAMHQSDQRTLLTGIVEMDETYVGGKPRKGGPPSPRGRGTKKTPVVGMVERGGRIRAKVVKKKDLTAKKLSALVRRNVDLENTSLITDEYSGYDRMAQMVDHHTINHQVAYADGEVHTNTIESFWALLKRGLVGQFHKVSLNYLPMYIDEFCYRQSNRDHHDLFGLTLARGLGVA